MFENMALRGVLWT